MACAGNGRTALRPAAAALALGALASVGACAAPVPSAAAPSAADTVVTIELRPRVRVSGARVRLGDIAYLTASDLTLLRSLIALPIGAAPRPGSPASLDRDTIARWVESRSAAGVIRWTGANETVVDSAAQQLSGEVVEDAARSTLERWLSQRSVRAEVHPVSTVRDLMLPAGAVTLRVRPLASDARPARRMVVWVEAWVDERFVRTSAVSFEVNAWRPLTMASSDLDRGATLDPIVRGGAVEQREVDVTTLRRQPAEVGPPMGGADAGPTGSQRLRRRLRAGEVLTQAHLQQSPEVARGNWANLLARDGDVSIESRVEVLQDGRTGDTVRVRVPGASGEVLARVTGPGRVEVQP